MCPPPSRTAPAYHGCAIAATESHQSAAAQLDRPHDTGVQQEQLRTRIAQYSSFSYWEKYYFHFFTLLVALRTATRYIQVVSEEAVPKGCCYGAAGAAGRGKERQRGLRLPRRLRLPVASGAWRRSMCSEGGAAMTSAPLGRDRPTISGGPSMELSTGGVVRLDLQHGENSDSGLGRRGTEIQGEQEGGLGGQKHP